MESILSSPPIEPLLGTFGRENVKHQIRRILDDVRSQELRFDLEEVSRSVRLELERSQRPDLRPVINGTGVLIHTNLGRSPISREHQQEVEELLSGYSSLELDLANGSRGSRHHHIEKSARELFGSEGALLVNNNAAAVLLSLSAIAAGREVIVSRGELVEIGG
ncbi:MAG: L-seryl-tRNA(Sec) selenium transferase, partial [Acidobacteria bacterium]|nr:L-seryl-tRNA(Sec) selenium transferase [Acidobacteriota bacterium]